MVATEGGFTRHLPDGSEMSIFDASEKYHAEKVPLVILAGKEYGSGSSRDWAAKGPRLLGVRAVIAESYERIHRSNLVGMGILPLQFLPGENVETLKLTGEEVVEIAGIREVAEKVSSGRKITVRVKGGRNFRQWCASTLRRKRSTTRMAAYCSSCCGSCWLGKHSRRR